MEAKDGIFLCHKLLDTAHGRWTVGPDATGAICAGWRQHATHRHGGDSAPWELQVAERLDRITWVDP